MCYARYIWGAQGDSLPLQGRSIEVDRSGSYFLSPESDILNKRKTPWRLRD